MAIKPHTPAPDGPDAPDTSARHYVVGLVLIMLASVLLFGLTSWRMGPPVGDLTRISGLSERDYGWQGTKTGFTKDYFTEITQAELMSGVGTGDIVVFGDSFSATQVGNITWTNTLFAKSGRAIDLVDINALADIKDYFLSNTFQTNPPEVVIVEMGERTAFRRAQSLMNGANCSPLPAPVPISLNPVEVERVDWSMRRSFDSFDELVSWGALSLRLRLFSGTKTVTVDLSRDDLFTNVKSNQMLFYSSDILRHQASQLAPYTGPEAEQATICAIRDMIHAAKGKSQVYVMLAPDKRSIYKEWISTTLPSKDVHFLNALPNALGGHYIDLFSPLLEEVKRANRDVYFPNDTHWSDYGHARVGEYVSRAIGMDNSTIPTR